MTLNPNKVLTLAKIDEAIAALQKRREPLAEHVRENAAPGTQVVDAKGFQVVVKATPKQNLDSKKFQAEHPADKFPEYYETKTTFVTGNVKAEAREGYLVPGTTSLSIEITKRPEEA